MITYTRYRSEAPICGELTNKTTAQSGLLTDNLGLEKWTSEAKSKLLNPSWKRSPQFVFGFKYVPTATREGQKLIPTTFVKTVSERKVDRNVHYQKAYPPGEERAIVPSVTGGLVYTESVMIRILGKQAISLG